MPLDLVRRHRSSYICAAARGTPRRSRDARARNVVGSWPCEPKDNASARQPLAQLEISHVLINQMRRQRAASAAIGAAQLRKADPSCATTFTEALKDAMKAQDKRRMSTLRLITAALKDRDIERPRQRQGPAVGRRDLRPARQDDQAAPGDPRRSTPTTAAPSSPPRSARRSTSSPRFLPQQMSEDEAKAAIAAVVAETGAAGMKDMGKVMAALKERYRAAGWTSARPARRVKARAFEPEPSLRCRFCGFADFALGSRPAWAVARACRRAAPR